MAGFERLRRALRLTEGHDGLPGAAFVAEGMRRWLNRMRSEGAPELTRIGLTAEAVAGEPEEDLSRVGPTIRWRVTTGQGRCETLRPRDYST